MCQSCEHNENPEPEVVEEQEVATCEACSEPEDDCECVSCSYRRCDWRGPADDGYCSGCERCENHCHCWTCDGCNERLSEDNSSCSNCHQCNSCCECSYCQGCQEDCDSDDYCSDCDRCNDCCQCSESPVEFVNREPVFHKADRSQHKRNPSRRFISVEVEVASADADGGIEGVCCKWANSIVEDGSLPDTGFEVCTSPAAGDVFAELIEEVCAALNDQDAKVDGSCGLHVHVDARDFSYWEIRKLILLYAKIEPALLKMQPASRRKSTYCYPCGEDYLSWLRNGTVKDTRKCVAKAVYGLENIRGMKGHKYNQARYQALNIHSWFYRGTVECRLHTGSVNAKKIIAWGILWAGILDSASRMTEKQIQALPNDPVECLLQISPTDECKAYVNERIALHGNS